MKCHFCGIKLDGDDDGTEVQCNKCGKTIFVECDGCGDEFLALFSGLFIIEEHGCNTAENYLREGIEHINSGRA